MLPLVKNCHFDISTVNDAGSEMTNSEEPDHNVTVYSRNARKTVVRVFDMVRHKPASSVTEVS